MNVGLVSNTYSGITKGQGALQSAKSNADNGINKPCDITPLIF